MIDESELVPNDIFEWISLIHVISNTLHPIKIGRISKSYKDLPVTTWISADIVRFTNFENRQLLQDIFMVAALEALIAVCKKYTLDDRAFVSERAKYGDIPETVEACQRIDRLLIS
ncbi:MAG: immunity protein 39 [Alphaproteobacteria bacterium]|nr:MAG: immunity protein 39 [Alphaproteobacteria bacterium]